MVFSSDKLQRLMAHASKQKQDLEDIALKNIDFSVLFIPCSSVGSFSCQKETLESTSLHLNRPAQKKKKKADQGKNSRRKKGNPSP